MKRMKKLLAFLLAAMLLLTMIPISASAADGNVTVVGDTYNGESVVYYNIYESHLLKLLYLHVDDSKKTSISADTEIEDVTLRLKEAVASSDERDVRYYANVSSDHMGGYYRTDHGISNSRLGAGGNPDNIASLEITYDQGTVTIPASDLRARLTSETLPTYTLEANDDSVHLVAFYYPESGTTVETPVYNDFQAIRFVKDGDIVTNVPNGPSFTAGGYAFVGWDNLPTGEDPFLAYEPVTADKLVYARVATSSWSISRYRVRNTDNELLNRVLELYNASQSTEATIDDIKLETVEIIVNGNNESTDPDFAGTGFGWQEDHGYFVVGNGGVSGLNDHIPADKVTSITVSATIMEGNVGKQMSFQLDRNSEPGGVSVSLGREDYAWIIVNPKPEVPGTDDWDDPDDEDADDLYAQTGVVVDCTIETASHTNGNYELENTNGTMKWSAVEKAYVYEIEVKPGAYVDKYNEDNEGTTHTLSPDDQSGTIVLVFEDDKWSAVDDKGTVTFTVTCEDEQGGGDEGPDAPTEGDINSALTDIIAVKCDQTDKHDTANLTKTFTATKDNATITEPTDGVQEDSEGDYTYTITVSLTDEQRNAFIEEFDSSAEHKFKSYDPETGKLEVTLKYLPASQSEPDKGYTWVPVAPVESSDLLTINVTCEGTGGDQPGEGETPTITDQDVIDALIGKVVVKIDCNNSKASHSDKTYKLSDLNVPKAGFCLNKPEDDGNGNWTVKVTIIPGEFVTKYSNDMNDAHKLNPYLEGNDYKTITLKWEGNDWVLADQKQIPVEYTVSCDVKTEIVEGPGGVVIVPVEPEDPTDPDQTGVADLLETDDHIQYLFGYPDGSFGPDRNMTRAEAAQMFYNLLKDQDVKAEAVFDDVPEGAWYATPVNIMAELGIVNGVGDDKFEPNREITRAEFTTMAMRFADVPSGGVNIFTDVAPSDWFYSYVVNSIQYGWIEGYGDGTFRPDRLITRAEVTTIVNRMLDRQADMAYVIQNRDKLTKFTDLTTEHWAYYTIVEATNEHNYKKPAIGEDWTSLNK